MTGPRTAADAPERGSGDDAHEESRVARNALFLVAGQVATAALSFGVTAILARYLGAPDYGVFYLATTLVQSAFVLVALGQEYYVVRAVAVDGRLVPSLLGTGLTLRLLGGIAAYPVMAAVALALGYPESTRMVVRLTVVFFVFSSIADGMNLVFRGLERMGAEAALRVVFKALVAGATVLPLVAGGTLVAVLRAQIVAAAVGVVFYVATLRRLGHRSLHLDVGTAASMLAGGGPFLLWSIASTAHSSTDVVMLSTLASGHAVGWYGAASKLVGLFVFPATILGTALYPTLARLHAEASKRYGAFVLSALRATVFLGVLAAISSYLFADDIVALVYGLDGFAPATGILKALSPYLVLVFIDITFGTALMAANAQTSWIVAKVGSVFLVAGLNSVLIPTFHARFGNGGLGSAAATVVAELLMLVTALRLVPLPKAALATALGKDLGRAGASAVAMAAVAWRLRDAPPAARLAAGLLTYGLGCVLLGGIRREDVAFARNVALFR